MLLLLVGIGIGLLVATLFLRTSTAADGTRADPVEVPAVGPENEVAALPLPVVEPLVGRAELVETAAAAAAAFAAGEPLTGLGAALADRRFQIDVPLGCGGAAPEDSTAPLRWRYDPETSVLTLTARMEDWTDTPFAPPPPDAPAFDSVEGFWIPHPWMRDAACPTAPVAEAEPAAPAPARQTVGLAQFFGPDEPRVLQPGKRPFSIVKKVAQESMAGVRNFSLLLRGRVKPLPDGSVARCVGDGREAVPVCLISVQFDYVGLRNPKTSDLLAEWH